MNKFLLLLILVVLLSGCFTTTKDAIVPPPEKIVHIDPRILEECEPLIKLPENASFEDLLSITVFNFEVYNICATKQHNSIILLKKFANKE